MALSKLAKGCAALALVMLFAVVFPAQSLAQGQAVTVTEDSETYTLDNGIITAVVSKRSGDLLSMEYRGQETLTTDSGGHSGAYWSHDPTGGTEQYARITIDPRTNGGERGEVSIVGISGGNMMGHGPGTPTSGNVAVDIDIRYALGRGERGVYTYTVFEHQPEYPAGTMAEARIAVELTSDFDFVHIDAARTGEYPTIPEAGIDKYAYIALQAEERAYGWTSPSRDIGWFLINPSAEYLSGGPTKVEFLAHGDPTVLNYWKSSHYAGGHVSFEEGEHWVKVIGPFMFYVNEGRSHEQMVADAQAQLAREEARWPYDWVNAEGYARPETRSDVTGRLVLNDPLSPTGSEYPGTLTIGLSKTPYTVNDARGEREIEWQTDGKYYEFWSENTDPYGRFTIPHVSPGEYNLYAYADGVLGEFSGGPVTISGDGQTVDLGDIQWTPVRHGRQLWDIGVADRSGAEFRYGERYFEPGVQLRLPELFPNGVDFTIGQSVEARDWFFAQVPTAPAGSNPEVRAFSGVIGTGNATPYDIYFDMPSAPRGLATLRLAITATGASEMPLAVSVNGQRAGEVRTERADGAIQRHQMYGRWYEVELRFDASLMRAGQNVLTITVPSGSYNAGVIYDYVRLELDEAAGAPARPAVETAAAAGDAIVPDVITIHDDPDFDLPDPVIGGLRFYEAEAPSGGIGVWAQDGARRPELQLDPVAMGFEGYLTEWSVSPDGRYIAFGMAEQDIDDSPRRVWLQDLFWNDLKRDERLEHVRFSALSWAPDSSGFYYSKYLDPYDDPERQRFNTAQSVFFHELGDDRLDDRRIYTSDRGGMIHFAEVTDDGEWLVVNGSVNGNGLSEVILIRRGQEHPAPFKAIRTMSNHWQFAGSNGPMIYFVTDADAPNGRLVALDTRQLQPRIVEIVPETDQVLAAGRLTDEGLFLSYGTDGNYQVQRRPVP